MIPYLLMFCGFPHRKIKTEILWLKNGPLCLYCRYSTCSNLINKVKLNLFACLSICLFIYLFVRLSVCLSVCLRLSVCMPVCLSTTFILCVYDCLPFYLYVHPSVYPSVCLSVLSSRSQNLLNRMCYTLLFITFLRLFFLGTYNLT